MHQTNIDRNNTRVSECEEFLNWDGEESYNISYYTSLCNIEGKRLVIFRHQYFCFCQFEIIKKIFSVNLLIYRIIINPDKVPYNMSEVILWTLDDGNTVSTLEMENDNEECYYFERLEKVLATQVKLELSANIEQLNLTSFITEAQTKT